MMTKPEVPVVASVDELRAQVAAWKRQGLRVGFVPTMGYLHRGHLSLIEKALTVSDVVVVSIFVNPTQFGPNEDLAQYPRDPEGDRAKVSEAGGALIFQPEVEVMYPPGAQTFVEVMELPRVLCGVNRPTHFRGVTTIVCKLFHLVTPDVAVFGEKDFQQLATIQRMVQDLHIPIEVLGGAIVREEDGVAMSSRNVYLTPTQREQAQVLSRALRLVKSAFKKGTHDVAVLMRLLHETITSVSEAEIDYAEIRKASDLSLVEGQTEATDRAFVAARFGKARLLDNAPLGLPCSLE